MIIIIKKAHAQNDKQKSKGNMIQDWQRMKVEERQEGKQKTESRKQYQMNNKESQRRNIVEDRQRKIKEKEKVENMQRKTGEKDRKQQTCKVQNTGKEKDWKEQDLKILKQRNICFIQRIDSNKEKKEENDGIELCLIYQGNILK